MNLILIAGCLAGLLAAPARAQSGSESGVYESHADAAFVNSDNQGNRGLVQEYDGHNSNMSSFAGRLGISFAGLVRPSSTPLYFSAGTAWQDSFDGDAAYELGIGSALRMSGDYESMIHRQPFIRSGIMLRGTTGTSYPNGGQPLDGFRANPTITDKGAFGSDLFIQRQTYDIRNEFSLPTGFPSSVFLDYWNANKKGKTPARYPSANAGIGEVDNTTQDYAAGAAVEAGNDAGAVYQHTYRTFKDDARLTYYTGTRPVKPRLQDLHWNANELKFRCTPSQTMAFTGFLSNKDRNNDFNGYIARAYTGSLAAAYNPYKDLALTARLYARGTMIKENDQTRDLYNQSLGDQDELDKNTWRGELSGRYVMGPVRLKGGYKLEYNQRRGASALVDSGNVYLRSAFYQDGVVIASDTSRNALATQDTKHILSADAAIELPLDMEIEADAKRMMTNRPVFEALPNWQDEAGVTLSVPLPKNFMLFTQMNYLEERNTVSTLGHSSRFEDTYLVGASWAGKIVMTGVDFSHENSRTQSEGWWGDYNTGTNWLTNLYHEPGMRYLNKNDELSAHARVKLPKGFAVSGRGAYGRSTGSVPVNLTVVRTIAGTDLGSVTDFAPSDVRITRLSFGIDYVPGKYDNLSARADYRVDRWTDKYDDLNSGRVNIAELGVSAKF